jgi:hypothetical protein
VLESLGDACERCIPYVVMGETAAGEGEGDTLTSCWCIVIYEGLDMAFRGDYKKGCFVG